MNFWQGEQIILRGIQPEDAEHFYRWNLDSERGRNLDFLWPPISLAGVRAWTAKQATQRMENDTFHWVITTLEQEPVGAISTHHCSPRNGTFSYGIDIAREYRRRGYAAAAIKLVLHYYFEHLRYQKVTVNINADNVASQQLHLQMGFIEEGRLRRMVYTQGQYVDSIWYGLTREEFNQIKKAKTRWNKSFQRQSSSRENGS